MFHKSQVAAIITEDTGGGIYNDLVQLKSGITLRISDSAVAVYPTMADCQEHQHPINTIYFPEPVKAAAHHG